MSASIQSRIHELERQLIQLRREMEPAAEAVPAQPFDALELIVDDQSYLLPVAPVREVLPALWPTRLPDAPVWVRGTFRYGEVVVPLVDLRMRLHGERRDIALDDVIVLVETPKWLGLLADGIRQISRVSPERLAPPSPGIPQAPFLLATLSDDDGHSAHLLSTARLGREFLVDDDQ